MDQGSTCRRRSLRQRGTLDLDMSSLDSAVTNSNPERVPFGISTAGVVNPRRSMLFSNEDVFHSPQPSTNSTSIFRNVASTIRRNVASRFLSANPQPMVIKHGLKPTDNKKPLSILKKNVKFVDEVCIPTMQQGPASFRTVRSPKSTRFQNNNHLSMVRSPKNSRFGAQRAVTMQGCQGHHQPHLQLTRNGKAAVTSCQPHHTMAPPPSFENEPTPLNRSLSGLMKEEVKTMTRHASFGPAIPMVSTFVEDGEDLELMKDNNRNYLEFVEKKYNELRLTSSYFQEMTPVARRNRQKLINWVVKLHLLMDLSQPTLHTAIGIVDRFLCSQNGTTPISKYAMCAELSLVIAWKTFENRAHQPTVTDFHSSMTSMYSAQDMLKTEIEILNAIEMNIMVPSAITFIQIYLQDAEIKPDDQCYDLVNLFADITLYEVEFTLLSPKKCAAGCIFLMIAITLSHWQRELGQHETQHTIWNKLFGSITKFQPFEVSPWAHAISNACDRFVDSKIYEKYSLPKFGSVSQMVWD